MTELDLVKFPANRYDARDQAPEVAYMDMF
jgi:hypothetical protein